MSVSPLAKVRSDEGALKTEGEEYQTHLEEELAESQARAPFLFAHCLSPPALVAPIDLGCR